MGCVGDLKDRFDIETLPTRSCHLVFLLCHFQVREVNFYQEGDLTHFNQELASCHIRRIWDELVEKSRYEERREHVESFNRLVLLCVI